MIWGQISAGTRAGDAKSQKIQHVLIGAVSAIVRATEYVLNKGGDQDLLTMLTDSIAFMLQCNHDHNHSRRLAMKKDLHKDFATLCNHLVITCLVICQKRLKKSRMLISLLRELERLEVTKQQVV